MNVMGIIFADDVVQGNLTELRTMASLPFGGRYRQIDFHLSNMVAAGIRQICVISRRNYQSLMNHIGSGEEWGLELEEGGLEFMTPYAANTGNNYHGKLGALHSALSVLDYCDENEYVIMAGSSVLANLDLNRILNAHIASGKDITVVAKAGVADGVKAQDLALKVDEKGNVTDMAVEYVASEEYLAAIDVFVLSKKWLRDKVREFIGRNLFHMDRDMILGLWQKGEVSVNVYSFGGVVMFNESEKEFFHNSLRLIDSDVRHDLFGRNHPIFTKVRDRVPAYYGEKCKIRDSIIADGCVLEGCVKNSILFRDISIREGACVENCVIMNDAVIGEGAQLQNVILDKDVVVRPGAKLIGAYNNPIIIKRGEIV